MAGHLSNYIGVKKNDLKVFCEKEEKELKDEKLFQIIFPEKYSYITQNIAKYPLSGLINDECHNAFGLLMQRKQEVEACIQSIVDKKDILLNTSRLMIELKKAFFERNDIKSVDDVKPYFHVYNSISIEEATTFCNATKSSYDSERLVFEAAVNSALNTVNQNEVFLGLWGFYCKINRIIQICHNSIDFLKEYKDKMVYNTEGLDQVVVKLSFYKKRINGK